MICFQGMKKLMGECMNKIKTSKILIIGGELGLSVFLPFLLDLGVGTIFIVVPKRKFRLYIVVMRFKSFLEKTEEETRQIFPTIVATIAFMQVNEY